MTGHGVVSATTSGSRRDRVGGHFFLLVVVCLVVAAAFAAKATATTGANALDELPIYKVSPRQARPFVGDFRLANSRGRHDDLISLAVSTKYDLLDPHYGQSGVAVLQGAMSVYQYDRSGRPASWVATLYEYHDVRGTMRIDLFAGVHNTLIGRLLLRPRRRGHLIGSLNLLAKRSKPRHGRRYRVRKSYAVALSPLTTEE
ncbi:MAG TPA: hypothetical protein VHA76_05985 [Solirubrobacterales bacterium]|nr:hypothetical protein [Solirubrobacterales bacterium]